MSLFYLAIVSPYAVAGNQYNTFCFAKMNSIRFARRPNAQSICANVPAFLFTAAIYAVCREKFDKTTNSKNRYRQGVSKPGKNLPHPVTRSEPTRKSKDLGQDFGIRSHLGQTCWGWPVWIRLIF